MCAGPITPVCAEGLFYGVKTSKAQCDGAGASCAWLDPCATHAGNTCAPGAGAAHACTCGETGYTGTGTPYCTLEPPCPQGCTGGAGCLGRTTQTGCLAVSGCAWDDPCDFEGGNNAIKYC